MRTSINLAQIQHLEMETSANGVSIMPRTKKKNKIASMNYVQKIVIIQCFLLLLYASTRYVILSDVIALQLK